MLSPNVSTTKVLFETTVNNIKGRSHAAQVVDMTLGTPSKLTNYSLKYVNLFIISAQSAKMYTLIYQYMAV